MEAQRYPDDFDGIVAGAPAYNFTNIAGAFIKNLQAVFPTKDSARTPVVTSDNLALVERAALDRCDAADGVRDSVIDPPTKCRFSLDTVKACPGDTAGADCLTRAERHAIAAIYAPAKACWQGDLSRPAARRRARSGGMAPMDHRCGRGVARRDQRPGVQPAGCVRTGSVQYFVFSDPRVGLHQNTIFAHWPHDTAAVAPILNADNPDLSGLKAHHGKLILWHGWADPALNAVSTIDYYQRVKQRTPAANDFTRLYMLPGVVHCNGGPGPDPSTGSPRSSTGLNTARRRGGW